MSLTRRHSLEHQTFAFMAAQLGGVTPFDVRLLVAVLERGGEALTRELEADLICEGSHVRRGLGRLYRRGAAVGYAADGGERRRGIQTRVGLTELGLKAASATVGELVVDGATVRMVAS